MTSKNALKIWKPYKAGETPKGEAIRRTSKGWDLFWFYFHHAENDTLDFDAEKILESNLSKEEIMMFTNPKVKEFAADIFEMEFEEHSKIDEQKSLDWIKKVIINGFLKGKYLFRFYENGLAVCTKLKTVIQLRTALRK